MSKESFATKSIRQKIARYIRRFPGAFDRRENVVEIAVSPSEWDCVLTLLDESKATVKPIMGFAFAFRHDAAARAWIGVGRHWCYRGPAAIRKDRA